MTWERRGWILGLGAVVLGAVACGAMNDDLRSKLEQRARFDLRCDELTYTPFGDTRHVIKSYGVEGCGQRATYMLMSDYETWVMNTADGSSANGATRSDQQSRTTPTGR
jgi:hypothetical protein